MNLYELSNKYQELLNLMQSVDTTDPDTQEVFQDTLDSLDGAIEDKAENIVHVLNQLKYDEEVIGKEISRLQAKKRALSNNQKQLKDYLKDTMEFTGKTKIKSPLFSIWTQNNNPRMIVEDETKIPPQFFEEQQPKLNTKQLREYLKDREIDGVRMEQGRGVRFR